jgi:hypothetical protein
MKIYHFHDKSSGYNFGILALSCCSGAADTGVCLHYHEEKLPNVSLFS